MEKIGIVTPSFNKPLHVLTAVKSIIGQSHSNWEYYIVDNSTDEGKTREVIKKYLSTLSPTTRNKIFYIEKNFNQEFRNNNYVPSIITNELFKNMKTDFLFYISDDDYLERNCFDVLIAWFKINQDKKVVYFKLSLEKETTNSTTIVGELPAMNTFGTTFGKNKHTPLDYLDGGQVLFKKEVLDSMSYPFFPESMEKESACHCDGLFLQKLCNICDIYPVNYSSKLGCHRITNLSTWRKN